MAIWTSGIIRSRDKIKTLYVQLLKSYGHLGKVVIYRQRLPPLESHDFCLRDQREVTWKIEKIKNVGFRVEAQNANDQVVTDFFFCIQRMQEIYLSHMLW